MLADRPEEQMVLFKEIVFKKMTVRDAERIARKIAFDRVRKKEYVRDPEISEIEERLQETLGTRVHIERKEQGGYITIDFFTNDDLRTILGIIKSTKEGENPNRMLESFIATQQEKALNATPSEVIVEVSGAQNAEESVEVPDDVHLMDDRTKEEIKKSEEDVDLYNIKNFSI